VRSAKPGPTPTVRRSSADFVDVAAYRFYMLNAQGHIYKAEIIEAEDDSTAIAAADRLQEAHRLPRYEIWNGARRVLSKLGDAP
jgi:hypothetical protein